MRIYITKNRQGNTWSVWTMKSSIAKDIKIIASSVNSYSDAVKKASGLRGSFLTLDLKQLK